MKWLTRERVLLFVCLLVMTNIILTVSVGVENWSYIGTGQGLVLTILGAIILAIPDVPELRKLSSPSKLQKGVNILNEKQEIRSSQEGFDELVSLINEHTQRVRNDHSYKKLKFNESPYGAAPILAAFEGDDLARHQLTPGGFINQWMAEKRDSQVRLSGLILLIVGFLFQFMAFLIPT